MPLPKLPTKPATLLLAKDYPKASGANPVPFPEHEAAAAAPKKSARARLVEVLEPVAPPVMADLPTPAPKKTARKSAVKAAPPVSLPPCRRRLSLHRLPRRLPKLHP